MNIITPTYNPRLNKNEFRQRKNGQQNSFYRSNPSFKGDPVTSLFQTVSDKNVYGVLTKYFGGIPQRVDEKLIKLASTDGRLANKARFELEKGVSSIREKKIPESIAENVIFPFVTLPSYFGSWILKKAQKIPSKGISEAAERARNLPIFRVPRKLNEMNTLTNSIDGMVKKTQGLVEEFAKKTPSLAREFAEKNGLEPEKIISLLQQKEEKLAGDDKKLHKAVMGYMQDRVYQVLQQAEDKLSGEDLALYKKADSFMQGSLYKTANKFFDKHTGNFNTAHERPLNRIVTGMIPVAFLANDAYNLSVMCGDKKEDSVKEANTRTKQEITRVLVTAYIQLLTFGAFTKQVNTSKYFAPLMSGLTVLFSEIFSRKRLGRPIMFLTKEGAKEYNRTHKDGEKNVKKGFGKSAQKADNKPEQLKNLYSANKNDSKIFTSFKGSDNQAQNEKKPKEQKALINFKTFKKGVGILLAGGFILSFIKNSSFTKDKKLVKGIKSLFDSAKEKIYNPLAFQDFEMSEKEFSEITSGLRKSGHESLAKGHEAVKAAYQRVQDGKGTFKMVKASVDDKQISSLIDKAIEAVNSAGKKLSDAERQELETSIRTAIRLQEVNIAEMNFEEVARQVEQIVTNKKLHIDAKQMPALVKTITKALSASDGHSEKAIKMDTKLKPYVDMVTQPFKFIGSVMAFPFKKIAKPLIGMLTSGVEKRIAAAELGEGTLKKYDKTIHRAVTEVFGVKKEKADKISQTVFANAIEQLNKKTQPYRAARDAYEALLGKALDEHIPFDKLHEDPDILSARNKLQQEKINLSKYVTNAVTKSFDGVTQSSKKNTDLAMMSKIASSTVTSAFLVADNYNMVMLKSDGEDKEHAKEKANERIIQRLSALFYQTMLINWFNQTFTNTYNSSLKGMAMVSGPNTIATEVLTRKSIGMPLGRKSIEELNAIDEKNEKRTGFLGKYFKFMRLLTGKKPLKDRLPKNKNTAEPAKKQTTSNLLGMTGTTTNVLQDLLAKK